VTPSIEGTELLLPPKGDPNLSVTWLKADDIPETLRKVVTGGREGLARHLPQVAPPPHSFHRARRPRRRLRQPSPPPGRPPALRRRRERPHRRRGYPKADPLTLGATACGSTSLAPPSRQRHTPRHLRRLLFSPCVRCSRAPEASRACELHKRRTPAPGS